jgi:radical SAM superfamily enzyme YgiQ (UPF0313 family)
MADIILVKLEKVGSETDVRGIHPPFSILYLADALEKAEFSVKIIHEEATKANIQKLMVLVAKEKPFLVGFSVATGPQIIPSLQLSQAIKEKFRTPIVWGGIQPTLLPQQTLSKDFIDIIAIGEGEETIVELAQVLSQHGLKSDRLEKIAGIAFRESGQLHFTEQRKFITNLDKYRAAWHQLDIERYIKPEIYLESKLGGERGLAINTSRGCPWRCGYCYNVAFNKRTFRSQSAPRVIEEIKELKERYNLSSIRFSDDHFFSNRSRALEIIRYTGIPWTATIRANDLTSGGENFVREIAESRCAFLRCGAESGSQRILDFMQKDITLDQTREAARLCSKYNLRVGFFFMLGFPGETWEDICKTLDLMDKLEAMSENISASLPAVFCPFPGAPLLDIAIKNGFRSPTTLEEWGTTDDMIVRNTGYLPPYVDKRVDKIIEYLRLIRVRNFNNPLLSLLAKLFSRLAKWRWKHRFFNLPIDWYIADLGRRNLQKMGKM